MRGTGTREATHPPQGYLHALGYYDTFHSEYYNAPLRDIHNASFWSQE
jgi:hypothetical protein